MTEPTFDKLCKRFGIGPDRIDSPKGDAIRIVAAAMDIWTGGTTPTVSEAVGRAVTGAHPVIHGRILFDDVMRNSVFGIVTGMMECLTTEWHG